MTQNGRAAAVLLEVNDLCADRTAEFGDATLGEFPKIDDQGVDEENAILVIEQQRSLLLSTMTVVDGEWLVDTPPNLWRAQDLTGTAAASEEARTVAEGYVSAVREHDGRAACSFHTAGSQNERARNLLFIPDGDGPVRGNAVKELEAKCAQSFEGPLGRNQERPVDIADVVAAGDLAIAYPPNDGFFMMRKTPDGWKVDETFELGVD